MVITPGVEGSVPGDTAKERAVLLPQPLLAFTVIFPAVVPADTAIEFVVELPPQPEGTVQV